MIRSLFSRRTLDDEVRAAQAEQPRYSHRHLGLYAALVAVAAFIASAGYSQVVPVWTNMGETISGPYIDSNLVDLGITTNKVRRFSQTIKNITTGEDLSLIKYQFPAGTNNGIVHAHIGDDWEQTQWSVDPQSDKTVLTANGNAIGPEATAIFNFYTTDIDPAGDITNGTALAKGLDNHFDYFILNTPSSGDTNMPVNIPSSEPDLVPVVSTYSGNGTNTPSGTFYVQSGASTSIQMRATDPKHYISEITHLINGATNQHLTFSESAVISTNYPLENITQSNNVHTVYKKEKPKGTVIIIR